MSTLDKNSRLNNITIENNQVSLNYEGASSDTYSLSKVNRIKIELFPTVYINNESPDSSSQGELDPGQIPLVTNLSYGWYNDNYRVDAAIDDYVVHHYNFGSQTVSQLVKKLVLD